MLELGGHHITFPALANSAWEQFQQDETPQETENSLYPGGPVLHEVHSDEELAETVTLSTKTMLADLTIMMVLKPESITASCKPHCHCGEAEPRVSQQQQQGVYRHRGEPEGH